MNKTVLTISYMHSNQSAKSNFHPIWKVFEFRSLPIFNKSISPFDKATFPPAEHGHFMHKSYLGKPGTHSHSSLTDHTRVVIC
ncbi:hypothetical protein VIGAN_03082100 [Vigna angularis var. angularis]|uniref:Uncharacterized protein n=1 Tax=Vigna angularis var. angularis TaxID=157739 RepID=A0A0S3RKR6_PHAAN|nr:hypothetical protein VIGAN_03082100 [Vigna angularis var. angularis]